MVSCRACGGTSLTPWSSARDVEYHTLPGAFPYLHCEACDALSIAEAPVGQLGTIYPPNYYSFGDDAGAPGLVQRIKDALDVRWFRREIRRVPGEALRALDVGGGIGRQLDQLRAADPRVTRTVVVDLDAGAEPHARRRGHEFVAGRIEDVRLDGEFDVILALNLIEHVEDPAAVLQRLRERLAPGGIILVKTPNHRSLDARIFRHRSWGGLHCPRHWVLFTPPSFTRLAREAGLSVRRWRYTQGAPFWTVSVLALLRDLRLVRVDASRPAYRHPLYAPLAGAFAAFDFARGMFAPLSQMVFVLERAR